MTTQPTSSDEALHATWRHRRAMATSDTVDVTASLVRHDPQHATEIASPMLRAYPRRGMVNRSIGTHPRNSVSGIRRLLSSKLSWTTEWRFNFDQSFPKDEPNSFRRGTATVVIPFIRGFRNGGVTTRRREDVAALT